MDDDRDKEMARNHMIALILMLLLMVVWFKWFMPTPPPPQTTPIEETTEEAPPEQEPSGLQRAETPGPAAPGSETIGPSRLPEVPERVEPETDEVVIENDRLRLAFTRIGGRLKRAYVLLGDNGKDTVQLVPQNEEAPDTETVYPLGLRFTDEALRDELDRRRFDADLASSGDAVTFRLRIPGAAVVEKRFSLTETPYVLNAEVAYKNLSSSSVVLGMDKTPAYFFNWGPNVSSGDVKKGMKQAFVWRWEEEIETLETSDVKPSKDGKPFLKNIGAPEWLAVRSAYFVVALKPLYESAHAWITGTGQKFRVGLTVPRFELEPGGETSHQFMLYLGPNQTQRLAAAWPTLPSVLRFFKSVEFMDWFSKLLLRVLNWFHDHVVANYGLAIIFLTVVVRTLMYPLTVKSMRSMKRMQLLAPEMEEIRTKYKDNPQEQQKKIMELYKERGVNPLGGCFPMLLQMPVFIALYRMLWNAFELRGAPFVLWIQDLSQPDQLLALPFMEHVPFLAGFFEYLNLLPILMAVAMVAHQKLMPTSGPAQNPQQKFMMTFMPIFFGFITYNMASGLNLYILTSTILGMVQQYFTPKGDLEVKPKKKKAVPKKQHFYTAAKARQRQIQKEMKQTRKRK